MVVVENRRHALYEVFIVRNLNDDVAIDARLGVIMPDEDGAKVIFALEVDLDPLHAGAQFDEISVLAGFLAVRDEPGLADHRLPVAGRHRPPKRNELCPFRDEERAARLARYDLEVRGFDIPRRSDEHRLGELELQLFFIGVLRLGLGDCAQYGQQAEHGGESIDDGFFDHTEFLSDCDFLHRMMILIIYLE